MGIFANYLNLCNMTNVPYLDWRDNINEIVPDNMRIGEDLLIVEKLHHLNTYAGPLRVDMGNVIIIDKGWSRMRIDMNEYVAHAPCLLMLLPDRIFQPLECSDDMEFRAIALSRNFFNSIFHDYGSQGTLLPLMTENPIMSLDDRILSFNAYYKTLTAIVKSPFSVFKLESARHLTLSIFYSYVRRLHETVKERSRQDVIYERFLTELKQYYRIQRDIPFYAGRCGITPKYLSQIVKERSGRTISDCIEDYVITECKALLASTDMTISQISRSMHFLTQSVFGKYFKRVTGMSPMEYRESVRAHMSDNVREEGV